MTPKEKAEELVKMFDFIYTNDGLGIQDNELTQEDRIQCALITVDEVIKHIRVNLGSGTHQGVWWLEVKQEIEKL
jgi:hypothetical protein